MDLAGMDLTMVETVEQLQAALCTVDLPAVRTMDGGTLVQFAAGGPGSLLAIVLQCVAIRVKPHTGGH